MDAIDYDAALDPELGLSGQPNSDLCMDQTEGRVYIGDAIDYDEAPDPELSLSGQPGGDLGTDQTGDQVCIWDAIDCDAAPDPKTSFKEHSESNMYTGQTLDQDVFHCDAAPDLETTLNGQLDRNVCTDLTEDQVCLGGYTAVKTPVKYSFIKEQVRRKIPSLRVKLKTWKKPKKWKEMHSNLRRKVKSPRNRPRLKTLHLKPETRSCNVSMLLTKPPLSLLNVETIAEIYFVKPKYVKVHQLQFLEQLSVFTDIPDKFCTNIYSKSFTVFDIISRLSKKDLLQLSKESIHIGKTMNSCVPKFDNNTRQFFLDLIDEVKKSGEVTKGRIKLDNQHAWVFITDGNHNIKYFNAQRPDSKHSEVLLCEKINDFLEDQSLDPRNLKIFCIL
ncbi:uncharacterized protein LOC108928297 isoform X2 [Scleropages formosus]|uniref:uncharacterized protein LOC108928297 isoform X2 n=1 Tax=Scleropages formosus TaxID=113540 RepID=UPI00087839AE|nr:uncharacterized protein LOC108928297 isoform X2 [Scleropages formosus]